MAAPKTTGIAFADVKEGDELYFTIRDTGFGGSGLMYRVGKVGKVTEKTVTLKYQTHGSYDARTARIRRADWHERCLGKVVDGDENGD